VTPAANIEPTTLYCEDNLYRLSALPADSIDLIYLDPPFFSNRQYEVIWGDEAEVRSFEDRWEGGIKSYIQWMRDRVIEMHRILRCTGSLYLHCDPHASHYLKVALDEVFGMENFRNEIIWRRTGAHGKARHFGPIHDTILFYTKSNSYVWNPIKRPYMRGHVQQYFVKDNNGWRTNYYGNVLTGSGRRGGLSGQPWRGIDPSAKGRHWAIPRALLDEIDEDLSHLNQHEKLDRLLELGHITIDRDSYWPIYHRYIKPQDGTPAPDIWAYQPYTEKTVFGTDEGVDADVRWLSTRDKERLGYPTQKPEALLSRIISASSQEGAFVLDPFCGCGTTVVVAERMRRKWIGIDISLTATNIMRERVKRVTNGQCTPKVVGIPKTEDDLRELRTFEFQNWVIQKCWATHSPRKQGKAGIDGYSYMVNDPIRIRQSDKVDRETVANFLATMRNLDKNTGYIVAFSFAKNAYEEVAKARWESGLHVQLVRAGEFLSPAEDRGPLLHDAPLITQLPPLPQCRPKDARPTAHELIQSDLRSAG
jgi:DNA modification methylase